MNIRFGVNAVRNSVLVIAVLLGAGGACAKRVALLIGNEAYAHESQLRNPVNDARLLEQTLKDMRFDEVTVRTNLNRAQLLQELAVFRDSARNADVAIVYYSGHGMTNSRRHNHLLPVDMPKSSANASMNVDTALDISAVSEERVVQAVEGAKVQLVILDACRDSGFNLSRSGSKGLARRIDEARNRLVAYSTEEGRVAEDGRGRNSTYAESLARNLRRTHWSLLRVFDEVASDVERATSGAQLPTRTGNLRSDVYLGQAVHVRESDDEAWSIARSVNNKVAYEAYLQGYPNGKFKTAAQIALSAFAVQALCEPRAHIVKPGDTIIRVALEHGVSWRDIVRLNNIENPNVFEVGQRLAIPCK